MFLNMFNIFQECVYSRLRYPPDLLGNCINSAVGGHIRTSGTGDLILNNPILKVKSLYLNEETNGGFNMGKYNLSYMVLS